MLKSCFNWSHLVVFQCFTGGLEASRFNYLFFDWPTLRRINWILFVKHCGPTRENLITNFTNSRTSRVFFISRGRFKAIIKVNIQDSVGSSLSAKSNLSRREEVLTQTPGLFTLVYECKVFGLTLLRIVLNSTPRIGLALLGWKKNVYVHNGCYNTGSRERGGGDSLEKINRMCDWDYGASGRNFIFPDCRL